jgi:hypothetical protein
MTNEVLLDYLGQSVLAGSDYRTWVQRHWQLENVGYSASRQAFMMKVCSEGESLWNLQNDLAANRVITARLSIQPYLFPSRTNQMPRSV